ANLQQHQCRTGEPFGLRRDGEGTPRLYPARALREGDPGVAGELGGMSSSLRLTIRPGDIAGRLRRCRSLPQWPTRHCTRPRGRWNILAGMITSARLVDALVERLRAVLPAGFEVVAANGGQSVAIKVNGDLSRLSLVAPVLDSGGEDAVERAVGQVLSDVQDEIAEESRTPWPGQTTMPISGATVRDGEIHAWFGDERAPTLGLLPIALDA